MHPPFFTVDHRIGPDIHHDGDSKPIKRRSLPERLRLTPVAAGWPPVRLHPVWPEDNAASQLPRATMMENRPMLHIVPPPRRTWRDIVGRWLIRVGQRMILQNRLG